MNLIQRLRCLKLNQDSILDKQIGVVIADNDSVVEHLQRMLLNDLESGLAQLMR